MTIGEQLKQYRRENGLSQEQLAERLTVSRQAITKWETDRGLPDIDNLIEISKTLNVSLDELVLGSRNTGEEAGRKRKRNMRIYLTVTIAFFLAAVLRAIVFVLDLGDTEYLYAGLNLCYTGVFVWLGVICFRQYQSEREQE